MTDLTNYFLKETKNTCYFFRKIERFCWGTKRRLRRAHKERYALYQNKCCKMDANGKVSKEVGEKYAKGYADMKLIKVVETAEDDVLEMPFTFQIVYQKDQEYMTWYFACHFRQQRDDWIKEIRKAAKAEKATFWDKYHPGDWKQQKWACCRRSSKDAAGCKTASVPGQPQELPTKVDTNGEKAKNNKQASSVPYTRQQIRKRMVTAKADFEKQQDGDISLKRGMLYEIYDDTHDVWWTVKSPSGEVGSAPKNLLVAVSAEDLPYMSRPPAPLPKPSFANDRTEEKKRHDDTPIPRERTVAHNEENLTNYNWYFQKMPREMVSPILTAKRKDGCFLVRDSTSASGYVLSVYSERLGKVKHYKVKKDRNNQYHFNDYYRFETVSELIEHHKNKTSGLETVLSVVPIDKGYIDGPWIIDESSLTKGERIGSGHTARVYKGTLKQGRRAKPVAVKSLDFETDKLVDVIREISTMARLQHPNLVGLHGICFEQDHINIVSEFMPQGDLHRYLERQQGVLRNDPDTLLEILIQVGSAMCFLEKENYIHRDLAARNCLVGQGQVIKVCDFGLSRFLIEGIYESQSSSIPLRWSPPEVLESQLFSSKSDVWSFGVLAWEIYSFGEMPYSDITRQELVKEVVWHNYRLAKPEVCPYDVFGVIELCWEKDPNGRPSFNSLQDMLERLQRA